jgi:hypothetical protein
MRYGSVKLPAMRNPFCKRRIIALAAAYLVALQALLLPLSVAAGSPFVGPPCSTSVSQPGSQPVKHDTGCPCAAGCGMQCCAQALAAPSPELSARIPVISYAMALQLTPVVERRTPIRSPSIPRAPPAA